MLLLNIHLFKDSLPWCIHTLTKTKMINPWKVVIQIFSESVIQVYRIESRLIHVAGRKI